MKFLFENHEIDIDRRELRRGAEPLDIEPQVFDLLVYLIRHRDRVVSKDDLIEGVWHGRIVSESALTSRISAARKAVGDDGDAQRLIRTVPRKGLRFVGAVREGASMVAEPPPKAAIARTQEIRFCTSPDGTRIAHASVGEGPPLLKAANWLSHLEHDWEGPIWTDLLQALAAKNRLVRYDARGNGLSDWDVRDISFEAFVQDLESVVAATGVSRFPLFGISQGCAVSIAYAVRHPERVERLVLYGGFARGKRHRGSQEMIDQSYAALTLMRQGWGTDNPAFRQFFTSLFIPDGTPDQMRWWNEVQRRTASPENAARIRDVVDDIDVEELLPQVRVPTLVLHCRDDAVAPFEEGRRMAAGIPGARFVALEGRNHIITSSDPSWNRFVDAVGKFLAQ